MSVSESSYLTGPCVAVMETCLEGCYEIGGYVGYDDELEYTPAYVCWYEGHTSNCTDYMRAHLACGGDDYSEAGADGCYGLCEATDSAWDEGPWDFCTESCDDICISTVQECQVECPEEDLACQEAFSLHLL